MYAFGGGVSLYHGMRCHGCGLPVTPPVRGQHAHEGRKGGEGTLVLKGIICWQKGDAPPQIFRNFENCRQHKAGERGKRRSCTKQRVIQKQKKDEALMCNPCNSVFFKLVAFGCASSPSHTKTVLTFAHKHTARSHALIYKLETVFVLLLMQGMGQTAGTTCPASIPTSPGISS